MYIFEISSVLSHLNVARLRLIDRDAVWESSYGALRAPSHVSNGHDNKSVSELNARRRPYNVDKLISFIKQVKNAFRIPSLSLTPSNILTISFNNNYKLIIILLVSNSRACPAAVGSATTGFGNHGVRQPHPFFFWNFIAEIETGIFFIFGKFLKKWFIIPPQSMAQVTGNWWSLTSFCPKMWND